MKKLLFLSLAVIGCTTTFAQPTPPCLPNPAYANSPFGVWPDTTENLPCAFTEALSYEAIINLKTLTDTAFTVSLLGAPSTFQAKVSAFRIFELSGLPAGFTWTPNQIEWINTGTAPNLSPVQGCVTIFAPQAAVQSALSVSTGIDYPLNILVDVKIETLTPQIPFVNTNGKWLSELGISALGPIAANGYRLRVRPGASGNCESILSSGNSLQLTNFKVDGNFPNPFNKQTEIKIQSPKNTEANLKVYSMLGKIVSNKKVKLERGENLITFQAENLVSGIYIYTIELDGKIITKKMNISTN